MVEGSWNEEAKTPTIDWSVSVALETVDRGGQDVAGMTNLEGAVRTWLALDVEHQRDAVLTIEYPLQLDGVAAAQFSEATMIALAEHLPSGKD